MVGEFDSPWSKQKPEQIGMEGLKGEKKSHRIEYLAHKLAHACRIHQISRKGHGQGPTELAEMETNGSQRTYLMS
jgi:hypothetical protein